MKTGKGKGRMGWSLLACYSVYQSSFLAFLEVMIFFYLQVASKNSAVEEQGQSNTNVLCRMCFLGENEGSERARRMLSCRNCGKNYHRSCLKSWAQHRGTKLYCPIIFQVCKQLLGFGALYRGTIIYYPVILYYCSLIHLA